jgi:hypothetical protein
MPLILITMAVTVSFVTRERVTSLRAAVEALVVHPMHELAFIIVVIFMTGISTLVVATTVVLTVVIAGIVCISKRESSQK